MDTATDIDNIIKHLSISYNIDEKLVKIDIDAVIRDFTERNLLEQA